MSLDCPTDSEAVPSICSSFLALTARLKAIATAKQPASQARRERQVEPPEQPEIFRQLPTSRRY